MKKMIFLVLLPFLGCFQNSLAQEEKDPIKSKDVKMKKIYIGTLQATSPLSYRSPSEYCLEDGFLYKSANYKIGSLFVHLDSAEDIAGLVGKMVQLSGTLEVDLNKIIVKQGKAPSDYGREQSMMQIRSDWVGEETGFNIGHSTKEKLKRVPFFRCSEIKVYKGLSVETKEEETVLSFTNNLSEEISELWLGAHYESHGRPVPKDMGNTLSHLAPGQSVSLSFPNRIKEPRLSFGIQTIQVQATNDNIEIKIEFSVE